MKKIFAAVLAVAIIFTFIGCTKAEPKFYEADAVADALSQNLEFGEELEKSTAEIAYTIFGIDPNLCTNAALYTGSGATADEIAVFNCIDDAAAEVVYKAAETRLQYLYDGYSSYGPDEVSKIEASSVIREGNTVIFCVCNNFDAVQRIADSAAE